MGLYRISALANLQSNHFSEIRLSLAPAKFLAEFAGFVVQLITDKTNAAVRVSVTQTK